jgi:hypothetical protein
MEERLGTRPDRAGSGFGGGTTDPDPQLRLLERCRQRLAE